MTKAKELNDRDVIATFRVILAACVQQYGVLNTLILTRKEMEAAGVGTLSVTDRPDGSIVLKVKGAKALILQ